MQNHLPKVVLVKKFFEKLHKASQKLCRDPGSVIYPGIILEITCKKFHPGKFVSCFCTDGIPLCQDKIFACNRFRPPKRDEKGN